MIKKLEKHLTFLFFLTTSAILTLVLILAFFYQSKLHSSQKNQQFQSQLLDLTHRLEETSSFSDDWLASLERDGKLIIHIEDNGTPLFFRGAWTPKTNRQKLVDLTKKQALKEGVDTQSKPHSLSVSKSSVFQIKGEKHDTYMATAMVIATETGFRSLILLSDMSDVQRELLLQIDLFLLLEILGVLGLYLASRRLVKQAVKPVENYHEKQKDFISAASHELRSPLAVIQTSASAIKSMPEHAGEMANLIERECIRSGALIKNLLLLSSPEDETTDTFLIEDVEVDLLLLQLLENYDVLCSSKNISLKLKLPDEFLPNIQGNSAWIYQLLAILLDNAIAYGCDASESVPDITLSASFDSQSVVLAVADHGGGIPDDKKPYIFDRFYRADSSRNQKEHAGLGLSIAKMLADRMKAPLTVKDTSGGGATFEIKFKIAK